MPRREFSNGSSKIEKRAGVRPLENTPLTVRSSLELGAAFERRVRSQLASRIEHAEGWVERVTVRFEDVNGPKGGIDTACRIKTVMSGSPSIIVEKRASSHELAFSRAADAIGQALDRVRDKRRTRQHVRPQRPPQLAQEDSETERPPTSMAPRTTRQSAAKRAPVLRRHASHVPARRRG
jgi:hypothetical protein